MGAYFAIGTWVIAEVARLLVAQWKALGGGTGHLASRVRRRRTSCRVTGYRQTSSACARPPRGTFSPTGWRSRWPSATMAGDLRLVAHRQGLALAAVRDNVEAAQSVGVDARRMKWVVFLTAAFGDRPDGALIYSQTARISPDAAFSVTDWTAYVIFIVVIGGIGTIEGPILGVIVFFVLQNALSDYGSWYLIALGLIAIVVMLFAPRGLWGGHGPHRIAPFSGQAPAVPVRTTTFRRKADAMRTWTVGMAAMHGRRRQVPAPRTGPSVRSGAGSRQRSGPAIPPARSRHRSRGIANPPS